MSGRAIVATTAAAALALALGGCAYDYLQHTDRVAYSAGDAVKANLEGQTIDPEAPGKASTAGLGRNCPVIPREGSGGAPDSP
jgi:hypothetical protein